MMKTDINTLGKFYIVTNGSNERIKRLKLIREEELLSAAFGEYGHKMFPNHDEYLTASIAFLKGFIEGPEYITWYVPPPNGELDMKAIATQAMKEGNDIVVIQMDYETIDK